MPKIKELKPQKRIADPITFEVAEVIELNKQGVLCRVVDDTGIIDAFFDQFAEQIVVGKVFEMTGLKVRVVNNHIRLQMTKQTIVTKLPLKMAFKDMENDLSIKFFIEKEAEVKKQQTEKTEKKIQAERIEPPKNITKTNQVKEKIQVKEEQPEKKIRYEEKQRKYIPKEEKTQSNPSEPYKKQPENKQHKRKEQKQYRDYKKQAEDDDLPRRKKYVQKEEEKSFRDEKRPVQNAARVLLRNFSTNCDRLVNLFGEVHLDTKISRDKYFICAVADKTGVQFIEFDKKTKLEAKGWYRFNQFKVYADKVYGYVAAQQKQSSIEAVSNVQEVASNNRLYKS